MVITYDRKCLRPCFMLCPKAKAPFTHFMNAKCPSESAIVTIFFIADITITFALPDRIEHGQSYNWTPKITLMVMGSVAS